MKKLAIIFIALFSATTFVAAQQKQRVAVLPSVGDLEPKMLILLTDKVRELATQNLPMENFNILKQDVITKMIGEEELYRSCKEGVCIGDLAKKTNANYGARCDVVNLNGDLVLKFEMYSVNEESIFETFTSYGVNDFYGMLSALEARLPDVFRKMVVSLKQTNELAQASDQAATNTLGGEANPKSRISAGVGGFFADGSGGGLKWESTKENLAMPYSGGGAYLFFDAVYVEAFVGYFMGGGQWKSGDASPSRENSLPEMSRTCVNIGAFAKYPIGAGPVKAFPLVGVEYEASISGKLKSDVSETEFDGGDGRPKAGALSATWFKVGGGADFGLSQNLYLRTEVLYGYGRTANAYEKDRAKEEETAYGKKAEPRPANGLTIKAGAGVKF